MCLFFSDLDNTLIYSHHRKIDSPKLVVEHIDGKEQSFMTKYTYDFLVSADWLRLIPVTTRTEKQYNRIECFGELKIKYAIVCNGGKLLIDGKEDEEWSYETRIRTQDNCEYLEGITENISYLCENEVHRPTEYMRYVKCSNTKEVYRELIDLVDLAKVDIQMDNRKVYVFAKGITKGSAIERFMKKRSRETLLVAGDSMMDVSMLNMADYAFASQDIFDIIECKKKTKFEEGYLSDGICKSIFDMKVKGMI